MVVVSHLALFLGDKFRSRCDSCESHLLLFKTIYFPIAPLCVLFQNRAGHLQRPINLFLFFLAFAFF